MLSASFRWLAPLLIPVLVALGCDAGNTTETSGGSGGTSSKSATTGTGTFDSTSSGFGQVSSSTGDGSSSTGAPIMPLTIEPGTPTLDVVYGVPGQTVAFTAKDINGNVVNANWYVSAPEAGAIDDMGVFTASGNAGGDVTVSARYLNNAGDAKLHLNLTIRENPGGVSPGDQAILEAPGGQAEDAFRLVYPYDATVFPRGIPAPELHPEGTAATAFMLKVTMPGCDYTGFLAPAAQLAMTQATWDALGSCTDGSSATVELAKIVGGQKVAPVMQKWRIAKGSLHGTIYYNTYDSQLAGGTGAIMRIKGSSTTPEVLQGTCTVCHSISADGSTAAAANHGGGPGGVFDLSGGMLNPPLVWTTSEEAAFAALYPKNGEVLVTHAGGTPGSSGLIPSTLRQKTGQLIPSSGIESFYAQTPVFSPDGKVLAFLNRSPVDNSSVLGVLDYDHVNHKFSNYRDLADAMPGKHLSWPAITPDNTWVLAQEGVGDDLATWSNQTANIRAYHVQTGTYLDLPNLNVNGVPRPGRDHDKNYEPTVLPVPVGGYFWVMFTSRRTYGNRLMGGAWDTGGGSTKRLWVAAFDVTADGSFDPSHPPFYVSGQEINSGNSRGFWALDPCKAAGTSCETGDQCCDGFCNPDPNSPQNLVCGAPDGNCSDEFESCVTAADCCDATLLCIGGKCSSAPPS